MRHPFLRTLAGTTTDPNFENVTLLLHGDGTNGGQNNTFVDGSTNNFTITRNGNTTQGTFSPYGDNWSNYFDGTGDYLQLTGGDGFNLTGDFTVEAWIYRTTTGTQRIVGKWNNAGNLAWVLETSTTAIGFGVANSGTFSASLSFSATINLFAWNHVAVSRSGSTVRAFLNGADLGSATSSANCTANNTNPIQIGQTENVNYVNGYISNVRVVKGTAVYTAAFTVPTAPLTAITNTSLLTCQSNRFRDASTNNFTITRNGNVSVQRFSPFSPTAAYAAGTIGGSGYFDGNADWLEIASASALQLSSSDFCIECWIYPTALPGAGEASRFLLKNAGSYPTGFEWILQLSPDGSITFGVYTTAYSSITTSASLISSRSWYHIAVSRSGSNYGLFINGTRQGTLTLSGSIQSTSSAFAVGRDLENNQTRYLFGYVSDARIVKGSSVYDPTQTTLTVPTAPLTAITNTSLLLNFTNAAILDNAMMAVPETVGNAQIDTTTKKYGTGSLEFDGTGDYLSIPPTSEFEFGTGDFTVECWFYASTVSGGEIPIYKQHAASNGICEIRISSSKIYGKTVTDQTVGAGTTTLSTNTWYHVAFVKSSNVYTLYLNGVSEGGTVTNSTGIVRPTTVRVGSNQTAGVFFTGFIDDLRVTKGVARYTSNFTPPTAAFPDL